MIAASLPVPDKVMPSAVIAKSVLSFRYKPPLTVFVAVSATICDVKATLAVPTPDSADNVTVAVSPDRLCMPL